MRRIEPAEAEGRSFHSYLFYQLRELGSGEGVEVVTEEDPSLLMEGLALQLRHAITWQVVETGPPRWVTRVHRRADVAARDLIDLLSRDHERLDRLFATALHAVNRDDLEAARQPFEAFAHGLRNHLAVENDLLVPLFNLPRDPSGGDPTSVMLREHEQILEQTAMLEGMLETGADASEVAPFFAILSGSLAKHEAREEQNLFPSWNALLSKAGKEAWEDVFTEAKRMLSR